MKLSEGRISYLAHRIIEVLRDEGLAAFDNERVTLNEIKRMMAEEHERDAQIDAIVRKKIASLSRNVRPAAGVDVLYPPPRTGRRRRCGAGGLTSPISA
jgi:hypothetical protein